MKTGLEKTGKTARYFLLILSAVFSMLLIPACSQKAEAPAEIKPTIQPPVAERIKKELSQHGHVRVDDYFWLNQRENPKVLAYLTAENNYLNAMMKHTDGLREKLYNELIARIKKDDASVPFKHGGYYYYQRFETGKEYPCHCRRKGSLEGAEEIMLDVSDMAKGHNYYNVAGVKVSPDQKIAAFGVDTVSRRQYTLMFKNLETGKLYDETIANTSGSAVWANDNSTVFYTVKDETLRTYKVFKHRLGQPVSADKEIYFEKDVTFSLDIAKTKSEQYIFIISNSTMSSEYRYIDAAKPDSGFKVFQPRERDVLYSVNHMGDSFYIRTNLSARNFRLMKTSPKATQKEKWSEVIAHREDVLLEGFELFRDFLVLDEVREGLPQIQIIKWSDQSSHYLDFGEPVFTAGLSINKEFDSQKLRYDYSSLTTPASVYDYDMVKREKTLLKQDEAGPGFNPENYQAERHWVVARDGVKIPLSIVSRKGIEKNGNHPLLLNGYGSYGYSFADSFSSPFLSLMDRGVIIAIAHIRGGSEMGRRWYEDGKLLKKKNTFFDFIDCAEYLVKEKYTSSAKLFAKGGSAGGLLMGAVVNLKPELFKGVIANVPWVDVVTGMLDESIPLTTGEFDEWGNPKIKEYYDYMLSYSPYDNVEKKNYPAMLVTTGLHDSQVQYWDPAKWVAKMRYLKTDHNPLLLYTNMHGGHGGASGRFRHYREVAMEYAFLLDLAGIKN